jgi:hypothetical protein
MCDVDQYVSLSEPTYFWTPRHAGFILPR